MTTVSNEWPTFVKNFFTEMHFALDDFDPVLIIYIQFGYRNAVNEWLDTHLVKGNPDNEAIARWLWWAYSRIGDLSFLDVPPNYDFGKIIAVFMRLRGLVGPTIPDKEPL